jgi:hypothetical protein
MTNPDPKANIPWSVKGVSKEAREAAKKAAGEQGITMGEWLTRAIRSGDAVDSDSLPEATSGSGDAAPAHETAESNIADINGTSDQLRRGITERIAQSENRILAVVGPLQEIIQQMALRIEALEDRGTMQPAEHSAPTRIPANVYRKTSWDE